MVCPDVSRCCLRLRFLQTCPACLWFAKFVKLLDLTGAITLEPHTKLEAPSAVRKWDGVTRRLDESELYGETVAELLRVERIPLQEAVNHVLRTVLTWAKVVSAWARGEAPLRLRRLAGSAGTFIKTGGEA